jgi:hypothetical protein
MTDTPELVIRVQPGQLAESMDLRRTTALAECTNIDVDDDGVFVARNWPRLSSGEEVLWTVLAWLNGQADRPDEADLRAALDVPNLNAVLAVSGR